MSLSSKSIKDIKALVKTANASIRAEHNAIKKKVLDKIREERKLDIKTARTKYNEMLKKKLIPIARRGKEELIADLNKHKKHWAGPAAPAAPAEEKKAYVTKRIGGKIRRIPVENLKKAEEKKKIIKSSERRAKDAAKSEDAKKAKAAVLSKIRKTDAQQKALKPSIPKITITEAPKQKKKIVKKVKSQLPPLKEKPMKFKLPAAEKPKPTPKGGTSGKVDDKLKQLKKELKSKGVPARTLKFINSVKAAQEKLEELDEPDEDDKSVIVDPIYLKAVPAKDRKEVTNLVKLVLPRDEFDLEDQRDYFDDLKDMAEDWPNSASPRIKYEEKFDNAEKELFRLLHPNLFGKKSDAPAAKKKPKAKAKEEAAAAAASTAAKTAPKAAAKAAAAPKAKFKPDAAEADDSAKFKLKRSAADVEALKKLREFDRKRDISELHENYSKVDKNNIPLKIPKPSNQQEQRHNQERKQAIEYRSFAKKKLPNIEMLDKHIKANKGKKSLMDQYNADVKEPLKIVEQFKQKTDNGKLYNKHTGMVLALMEDIEQVQLRANQAIVENKNSYPEDYSPELAKVTASTKKQLEKRGF